MAQQLQTRVKVLTSAASTRLAWIGAGKGNDAATLIDAILEGRPHPEQGFRSAIGIIGLARRHGPERVDAACARAIALGTRSYGSVARILSNRAETLTPSPTEAPVLVHANIRGPGYYH